MMETLNTVWTALTTTNDELINIISIPMYFIDAYVVMILFTTILNIESTKKQKIQYVLSLSILAFIIRVIFKNPLATYLNMILTLVLIVKIFKTTFLKGLLALILQFSISVSLEYIYSKIYFILFKTTWDTLVHIPIFRVSVTLLIYLTIYLIFLGLLLY